MARSSMSVTIDKNALKRLDRKFAVDLPSAVNKALREAMPVIGMQFVAEARKLVPVRTGQLRDAIGYKIDSGGLAVNLFVDGSKLPPVSIEGRQVPGIVRAYWIEFGTSRQGAQPFFFAAWRVKKRAFATRLRRAAKKGVQQGAK